MQIRLSQPRPLARPRFNRGRTLVTLGLIALLLAAPTLLALPPDGTLAAGTFFLPLVLFGALGAGRELLSPSLRELAFYSVAITTAMAIWSGISLTVTAYEAAGLVTLLVFMGFVFALAIALGVLAVNLLARDDSET